MLSVCLFVVSGHHCALRELQIVISKLNTLNTMRFQVLVAVSMKFRVFWDILPCSQIDVDQRFRGVCCLHHQGPGSIYQKTLNFTLNTTYPALKHVIESGDRMEGIYHVAVH
jgi:hypothetical protein